VHQKGAGITLKAKIGGHVSKSGVLFEIYAERYTKLEAALQLADKLQPFGVGRKCEEQMLIDRIPNKVIHHKAFSIEW